MSITRRGFLGAGAAFTALSGCRMGGAANAAGKRWYKGNLHCHTFWSDGRAFPEEAVFWYKSRGYNFLGLSDHNVFQEDTDRWVSIVGDGTALKKPRNDGSIKYRYQPTVIHRYFDEYVKAFPDAVTRKNADGGIEARLSTFTELLVIFLSSA